MVSRWSRGGVHDDSISGGGSRRHLVNFQWISFASSPPSRQSSRAPLQGTDPTTKILFSISTNGEIFSVCETNHWSNFTVKLGAEEHSDGNPFLL